MKNDKRGIGGLMESMAAAMIVVLSLTAFMGLFGYVQMYGTEEEGNYGFVESLRIEDGKIVGDIHDKIVYLVESKGYAGMRIDVKTMGCVNELSFSDSFGSFDSDDVTSQQGSFEIQSDDGRRQIAGYEVVMWH